MRSFFAHCVFMYLYGLRVLAGGGKSDPPPALSALLSYRCVHVGVWRSFRLPGGFSSLHKILSWKFWTLHGLDKKDGKETVISVIYKKGVIVLFLLNCIFSKVFKC